MAKRFINILGKPYVLFWGFILILAVVEFNQRQQLLDSALDINIHDTYFVIANDHLIWIIQIYCFVLGLIYFLFERLKVQLKKGLNLIHTLITFLGTLFILYPFNIFDQPRSEDFPRYVPDLNSEITIMMIIVFLSQLVFLTNIMLSIFKKK